MGSLYGSGPEVFGSGQPIRRSRTWNDDGVQYTQQEFSYISPHTDSASRSRAPFADSNVSRKSQSHRGSLLGRLANGIVDMVASNTQPSNKNDRRRSRRQPYDEDVEVRKGGRQNHRHNHHSPSPSRRARRSGHRPQSRRTTVVEDFTSSDESNADSERTRQKSYGAVQYTDHREALENAAEFHREQADLARKQLEQACRQPMGNTRYLRELAQKAESHENSLKNALRDLRQDMASLQQRQRTQRRPRTHRRESATTDLDDGIIFDEAFSDPFVNDPLFHRFFSFGTQHRTAHPLFEEASHHDITPGFGASPFAAFDDLFADLHQANRVHHHFHQEFFGMPDVKFTASFGSRPQARRSTTMPSSGSRQQQPQSFTRSTPQPSAPPATLLKPAEARQLFKTYDERWHNLPPTDANVPFPARGLKKTSLGSRNSLWAPLVSSSIEAWSEETAMKANAQAFFLGAVGMRPAYSESAGAKIELGIDKASGSPEQAKQLLEILKKERTRWHSDRLGKRNGGRPGANEALQRDERARAVYHGVCELIEAAQ